jgi:replicative DNA helicase
MNEIEAVIETTYKEAEQILLGSILLRGRLFESIQTVVKASDFEELRHNLIFQAMGNMYMEDIPIEYGTVASELRRSGQLVAVCGEAYLALLVARSGTGEWRYYADLVREAAIVRRVRDMHLSGLERARPGAGFSSSELINIAQAEVNDLADGGSTEGDLTPASSLVWDTLIDIEKASLTGCGVVGVPSGIADLDRLTGGFVPGQMIVIAARPGIGKSTLGLDIARHAAFRQRSRTALFSLEMSQDEIMHRLLSAEGRLDLARVKTGRLTEDEWEQLASTASVVSAETLMIDTTANITMSEIKAKCRRMQARHGLDLVVVDYLQLIGSTKQTQSREQEVSAISRQVKLLGKELGVPVIIMAQLNRSSETRAGGRPILSDLRESGAIEQDADVVIFIHREDKVDENSPRVGEADLVIAKQRNGPTGTVPVGFQGRYSRFVNLARGLAEAD